MYMNTTKLTLGALLAFSVVLAGCTGIPQQRNGGGGDGKVLCKTIGDAHCRLKSNCNPNSRIVGTAKCRGGGVCCWDQKQTKRDSPSGNDPLFGN